MRNAQNLFYHLFQHQQKIKSANKIGMVNDEIQIYTRTQAKHYMVPKAR